ncbi:unnamed protein product [Moneuplotes crassus]|uniref:Uncharacterized protein n=1 Tax=Euplotes crassus TaxID=5936 RepID=A0AAD1Y1K9_EUPCR|nr:unnamed protein product [Moneuplotes crassus]
MSAPGQRASVGGHAPGQRTKPKGKKNMYKGMNPILKMFYILKNFTGKILWFGSCIAFLYFVPVNLLLFKDQEMVLNKMAMQGSIPGMGPPSM